MNKKSKEESKTLLSNMAVFGIGTFSTKLIMFFLLPIYTIYMTNSELGLGELVVNSMNFIYPIATLNIQTALFRFALDSSTDKKDVLKNATIVTLISIFISATIIYLCTFNSSMNNLKIYLCSLLLTYSIRQIFSIYTKALEKMSLFTIDNIFYTVCLFIFSVVFIVYLRRGTAGYLEAMILSNLASTIFLFFAVKIYNEYSTKQVDLVLLKNMVVFSIPLIINSVSWWISNIADRFILEYFKGLDAVGIYAVSAKIPALLTNVVAVFMQAWVMSAIKEYEKNNNSDFFKYIFEKFSFAVIMLSSIIILFSKLIITLLTGKDFISSWYYVPFLLLGATFSSFSDFFGAIYMSAKKNVQVMITTVAGAIINIILNIILIPKLGIQGAGLATMLSYLFISIYRMIDSKKYINFEVDLYKLLFGSMIMLFECFAVLFLQNGMFFAVILIIVILIIYNKDVSSFLKLLKQLVKKY